MMEDQELKRMRWAARRGMLELDLVLEPFVGARYAQLPRERQLLFQRLMECEDQDLFAWFLRRQRPDDEALADLVQEILQHAQTGP